MLTRFFADREKVNAEVYCKVLEDKIIPWMKEKGAGKEFVFQQDSAPAHTAKMIVNFLKVSSVRFWDKDLCDLIICMIKICISGHELKLRQLTMKHIRSVKGYINSEVDSNDSYLIHI